MRDFSRELNEALALGADVLCSVAEHLLRGRYGPNWFEGELRPRMVGGASRRGDRTAAKYAAFVRENGENFTPEQMDITVCASILLYDERYAPLAEAYGDRAIGAVNALRETRNDAAHAADLSPRERLGLAATVFGSTVAAASAFELAAFDKPLDCRIDEFARLFAPDAEEEELADDPFRRQLRQAHRLIASGDVQNALALCTELAGQDSVGAMLLLARLYRDGTVTPDYPRALYWLDRAAGEGSGQAEETRARLRAFMDELSRAQEGDASALFAVGQAYESGELIEKNQQKAYACYGRAIDAGSLLARHYVDARCAERDLDAVALKASRGDAGAAKLLKSLVRPARAAGEGKK